MTDVKVAVIGMGIVVGLLMFLAADWAWNVAEKVPGWLASLGDTDTIEYVDEEDEDE